MRVLLVQTAFLGDLVLSTGCIAKILDAHNLEQIDVLTTPVGSEILKLDPRIRKIFTLDKKNKLKSFEIIQKIRAEEYDIAYSLHKSYRTSLILSLGKIKVTYGFAESKLSFLYSKIVTRNKKLHEALRTQSLIPGDKIFPLKLYSEENVEEPKILIFPGSVWYTKRWQGFSELVNALKEKGYDPLIVGSFAEKELCEKTAKETNSQYKITSLSEALKLASNAKLIVSNDSFPLHLASCFKVPNVAIFCATSPASGFGPYENPKAIVVEKQGLKCKPCARHGGKVCPIATEECMKLDYQPVLQACLKLLL